MGTNTALKLPSLWALQLSIISWQNMKEKGVIVVLKKMPLKRYLAKIQVQNFKVEELC